MNPHNSSHPKSLTLVGRALKSLMGIQNPQKHYKVNPVDEVREGLKDIKAGRVSEIKSARDLLNDE